MTVNYQNVIRIMGIILLVLGVCLVPSLLVAFLYDEQESFKAFLWTIIPCIATGFMINKIFRPSRMNLKKRDGFLIVSAAWLMASLIGAIPFVISGAIPNYVDAFFETCSGFSTTGATILRDIESLPKSMLFWRSFAHWLGGMGIIVLTMAFLPSIGVKGQIIASAETPTPTLHKITPRFADTARNLYLVYLLFTVAELIMLLIGDMSLFDALIHTFGTVGTGGFSNYSNSVAHFNSPYIQWVIMIFMVLCGINFNLYFVLAKRGIKGMLKDAELRLYFTIILVATVLIAINLVTTGTYSSIGDGLRDSAFQVSSILTTTSYSVTNYDVWPTFSKMLILLLMLTGACSSSTGGGIKVIRILIALKLIRRGISLKLHPNRVASVTLDGKGVPQEISTNIANFIFFFMFIFFIGGVIISFNGYDLLTSFSAVLSCLNNTGQGFNLVGPTMNFGIFSEFSKVVLSFLMIAGRLELFTFFMLFSPHYWNSNRA